MCQPAPVATRAWADDHARYGDRVTFLGIVGDQAHQARTSGHNCAPRQERPVNGVAYDPGYAHAGDTGVGNDSALGREIVNARIRDPRVRYCIFQGVGYYGDNYSPGVTRRIWDAARRVFTRTGPRTFRASGHPTHVHTSYLPGTTHDTSPFYTDPTGGFGTMDDPQILDEFANVTKRTGAQLDALAADLRDQAKRHNEAARDRDAKLLAVLDRIAAKIGA